MARSVIVTTPFPTMDELAETLGVPEARRRELAALADELIAREKTAGGSAKAKRGVKSSGARFATKKQSAARKKR